MGTREELGARSGEKCELCGSVEKLDLFPVEPSDGTTEQCILVCSTCREMIDDPDSGNVNHWRCLNESMWSPHPAVQVTAYRILKSIASEGWPQELLDMIYLEPDIQAWADSADSNENSEPTLDSNGTELKEGDSVTIIKDLEVKGAGFTAKRGTVVKNIHLTDKATEIEGRVNGTRIVLLSKFLKKA